MGYRIGLDIGIGSVGWAVLNSHNGTAYIADFGVRIFESGENEKSRMSKCQERRGYRGTRRLERRRAFRKVMLYNHFAYNKILPDTFQDELFLCKDQDVYELKVKGLSEKLSIAELYKCLVHTCNHRGYRDFYEDDDSDDKDEGKNKAAVHTFDSLFSASGKRTVSEFLLSSYKNGNFVKYRNVTGSGNEYLLIHRYLLEDEVRQILYKQSEYYPELTDKVIEQAVNIVFTQRDFEDGPGDKNDEFRRYKGFVAELGNCPFYKDEKRGFRPSVIADVYAVVNTLSQYRYVNTDTGEIAFDAEVNSEIIDSLLVNGSITLTGVKKILKNHGIELVKSENSDDKALGKAVKFISTAKKCIEAVGESWENYIFEDQFNIEKPSRLSKISDVLSCYQTPRRRRDELKKLGFMSDQLIKEFMGRKLTGTARTSNKYMCEAIKAFLQGEIYGNFQAEMNKELDEVYNEKFDKLLPAHIDDPDVRKNAVVFKAINETRKIINAIVEKYGTPDTVIIEVADELGKSFDERSEIRRHQKQNEAANDAIKGNIVSLLKDKGVSELLDVTPDQIDKYKLYMQQEGKCLYSGRPLGDLTEVLLDKNKKYEVDHIVPYSLILDNTITNKALVFSSENQEKGQRTPLMYLTGEKAEKYKEFIKYLYTRDLKQSANKKNGDIHYPPVGKRKLEYLSLETIYSDEAKSILSQWKSRNINDTRYITKYITSIINRYLKFADSDKKNVYGLNGAITSKFRRIWFRNTPWGDEEKNRDTYLNHALDAVVIANLTPAYIEVASDAIKLQRLYRKGKRGSNNSEYQHYLDDCLKKMNKYYGFNQEYTLKLLYDPRIIPSYVPNLKDEVLIRFNDTNEEEFNKQVKRYYSHKGIGYSDMHMPIVSHKPERKFKGCVADSNPVRVVEIDGESYKLSRKNIMDITSKDIDSIRSNDKTLINDLHMILDGKDDKYSIKEYMLEKHETSFVTSKGQPIHRVSVISGKFSNFYKKNISDNSYSYLGMLKYYCVEVYKDTNDGLQLRGVRFVDLIKRNGKLCMKQESIPNDYREHVMYLNKNDYIVVYNKKGETKYQGHYDAVYNINQNTLYLKKDNCSKPCAASIGKKDTIIKYDISLLSQKKGQIKCSVPLSLTPERK